MFLLLMLFLPVRPRLEEAKTSTQSQIHTKIPIMRLGYLLVQYMRLMTRKLTKYTSMWMPVWMRDGKLEGGISVSSVCDEYSV